MKKRILEILDDSLHVKKTAVHANLDLIIKAGEIMADCLKADGKILIFGNGGSAADAQHIAAEFVNRFQIERPPLAAIALTTDSSILTSIGNDYSFDEIFSKQIAALGIKNDIAWGISTSGNSKNVVAAMDVAKEKGLTTIGMSGKGGKLADISDIVFKVDSDVTARIQETHITIGHMLCEIVDTILFP